MAQVKVIHKIKHSGLIYEAGDVLGSLTDTEAQALVDAGAAEFGKGDEPQSDGKRQEREPSRLKESLLNAAGKSKGGRRKSVSEKAQERAQRDKKPKDTDTTDTTKDTTEKNTDDTDNNDSQDQDDSGTKTAPSDNFELNGDAYSTKTARNGQVKYYKKSEGDKKPKEIKKVDYLMAKQEAQG